MISGDTSCGRNILEPGEDFAAQFQSQSVPGFKVATGRTEVERDQVGWLEQGRRMTESEKLEMFN